MTDPFFERLDCQCAEEMQPPPCADHETNELNCPVCSAQRRAFYVALGRALEADS